MVNNILKNPSDINDEIRNNILAEMDKYNPAKNDGKKSCNTGSLCITVLWQ